MTSEHIPASEPLSAVDAAWLHMEDPTNLMMVTGILLFDEPLDVDRLRTVLADRLLRHPRFRQRVVEARLPLRGPHWEFDPAFDLDSHIHRIALPAPHDDAALRSLVGDLMSTPLDFTRPLWDMHVVEGVGSGSALITRQHHCIADGIALVQLMLTLTDGGSPRRPRRANGAAHDRNDHGGALGSMWNAATHPGDVLGAAWRGVGAGIGAAGELARVTFLPSDPRTLFKGPLGRQKHAAWSPPLDLARVKAAGAMTGCTVNDVLMTLVTGVLRRHLESRGNLPDRTGIHVTIPVNLRRPGTELELGNRFGLVFLELPVGVDEPLARLFEVRRRMEALKGSAQAPVALGLLTLLGALPTDVQRPLIGFFGSKSTGVVTNVPGPRQRLRLAGSPIRGVMFWVPQSGHLGLGISVISYAGEVRIGVVTDAHLVADPTCLTAAFVPELERLEDELRRRAAAAAAIPHRDIEEMGT